MNAATHRSRSNEAEQARVQQEHDRMPSPATNHDTVMPDRVGSDEVHRRILLASQQSKVSVLESVTISDGAGKAALDFKFCAGSLEELVSRLGLELAKTYTLTFTCGICKRG